jgi:hypothetical protein
VPERERPGGLARRASAANATNESGGEAEIAGGVGVRGGAATRSLRSERGVAHSADAARPKMEVGGRTGRIALGNAGGVHLSTDMDCFLILLGRNILALAFLRRCGLHFS